MLKKLESFIRNNKCNFEKQNIEVFENLDEDSSYCDFISKNRIGRIVVWSNYRIELEILDITTELQVYFKYYELNVETFDEKIFHHFFDELVKE